MEKTPSKRTNQQNKALHVLFALVADEFEKAGVEMSIFAKLPIRVPWSEVIVKELWRAIQIAQVNKVSTSKLTRKEIELVYDTFNRMIAEEFHLHIAFPSIQQLLQDNE
ncbi:hypothetical protein LCGC14_0417830 [marine sediment metagenome]|uniref:Uncharacterized protein n=1 Tax=marine sediment metagenome TaxID=412755 RepID=A0A0F9T9T5_9ZZZZ